MGEKRMEPLPGINHLLKDVEKEAEKAEMTLAEYIEATQKINPQFERVYAL